MTEEDTEQRIPKLDPGIVEAADRGTLVLFVGAGVSRLVGCKGWGDLALDLLEICRDKEFINYRTFRELKDLTDHRQLITICFHILKDHRKEGLFYRKLRAALRTTKSRTKFMDVFELLSRMPHFCVVTTNADTNLDRYFDKQRIVAKAEQFPPKPESGFLYHLHGSTTERNEVFTLEQYFDQYSKGVGSVASRIPAFLEYLFTRCSVLFLGYGLSEFEILEFIFRQPKTPVLPSPRHFMLIEDFADSLRKSCLQPYYDIMHIQLISYSTDIRGYDELYYVIRDWSHQLEPAQRYAGLPDEQERLRKYATQAYGPETKEDVWDLLQRSDLASFFFNTLSDSSYEICRSWLSPLNEHKCFSVEDHPSLKQDESSSPPDEVFWRPIGYLHKVIESAIKLQESDALDIIAGIGTELAEILVGTPLKKYDWRTNQFILQALMVSKESLSKPTLLRVALSLMTVEPASLLLGITISEQLIRLLVQQGNGVALKMILDVSLTRLSTKQPQGNRDELAWDFDKTVMPHSAEIVQVCGLKAVRAGIDALRDWQRESKFDLTYYWVPSIEESDQNRDEGYSAPMAVVRFICAACDQISPEQRESIGERLLLSRANILRRIGYHLVDTHYGEMSAAFWQGKRNPLLDTDALHEVYLLFSSHAHEMNPEQVQVFLQWLRKAGLVWGREAGADGAARVALGKRFMAKWLLSVETSADTRIRNLVNESWSDRPRPTHPEWNFYIGKAERDTTGIVTSATLQEFETNEQLAAFLNATDVSSVYGALQEMVSNNPERLVARGLNDLLEVPIGFLQAIFHGFMLAIQNKRAFQVAPVLQLGESTLARLLESSERDPTKEDRRGACSAICEFVSTAVSHQPVAWTSEDDGLAQNLLQKAVKIASECPVTDPGLSKPRWRLVNSALASAIKASIFVAWGSKKARQGRKSISNMPLWVAAILKDVLNRTDPPLNTEAREGIAAELYVLNIVDPTWVSDHVGQVFPRESPNQWRDAFSAYLTAPVQKELFLSLRDRGDYSFAIGERFLEKETEQTVASHVCLAYMNDLDNGLMDKMLDDGEETRIGEVVWYFSNRLMKLTDLQCERLTQLWPKTIAAISRLTDESMRTRLLSTLPEWLNAFQRLPASAGDLLEKSFDGWDRHASSGLGILESLARFVDKDAERVGDILLIALRRNVVLAYPEEALVKIAETLCQQEFVSKAEEMHVEYSKRGVYVMAPVLKKWKKP
jgi:hypothetical protein